MTQVKATNLLRNRNRGRRERANKKMRVSLRGESGKEIMNTNPFRSELLTNSKMIKKWSMRTIHVNRNERRKRGYTSGRTTVQRTSRMSHPFQPQLEENRRKKDGKEIIEKRCKTMKKEHQRAKNDKHNQQYERWKMNNRERRMTTNSLRLTIEI